MRQGCNNYNQQQHKELLKAKNKASHTSGKQAETAHQQRRRLNGNKHTLQPWNFTN